MVTFYTDLRMHRKCCKLPFLECERTNVFVAISFVLQMIRDCADLTSGQMNFSADAADTTTDFMFGAGCEGQDTCV